MITRIEALRFRALRSISLPLERFQVMVGPNASGKTTLVDVVAVLGRMVSDGLDAALSERSANFQDLVWNREVGPSFELAVEASIPEERRLGDPATYDVVRHEVEVGMTPGTGELSILRETVLLRKERTEKPPQRELFPSGRTVPESILKGTGKLEPASLTGPRRRWRRRSRSQRFQDHLRSIRTSPRG